MRYGLKSYDWSKKGKNLIITYISPIKDNYYGILKTEIRDYLLKNFELCFLHTLRRKYINGKKCIIIEKNNTLLELIV